MKKLLLNGLFIVLVQLFISVRAEPPLLPTKFVSKPDEAEMLLIPNGEFIYGTDQKKLKRLIKNDLEESWADIYNEEKARQPINLPDFYIDRFEVTNEKYNRFSNASKHRPSQYKEYPQLNDPNQPVVGVGWADAEAYCQWSGKQLPTEEQWEKAARGTDERTWPWISENKGKIKDLDEYQLFFNGKAAKYLKPIKGGSFPKGDSPYGVADMAGNVWEMTSSITKWDDNTTSHVMRGGSFLNSLGTVRVTVRWSADDEKDGADWLGFRCVKNLPTQ